MYSFTATTTAGNIHEDQYGFVTLDVKVTVWNEEDDWQDDFTLALRPRINYNDQLQVDAGEIERAIRNPYSTGGEEWAGQAETMAAAINHAMSDQHIVSAFEQAERDSLDANPCMTGLELIETADGYAATAELVIEGQKKLRATLTLPAICGNPEEDIATQTDAILEQLVAGFGTDYASPAMAVSVSMDWAYDLTHAAGQTNIQLPCC